MVRLGVCIAALAAVLAVPAFATTKDQTSAWDQQWLTTSISGDRFEIAGGKIAQQMGQSAQVKALGARLVQDHSKSLAESIALAHSLGIKVPTTATPSMQWELKAVRQFTGKAFDANYASLEVMDHEQDITEAGSEWKDGTNVQVRDAAKKEIPTLKMHLALSRKALAAG